MCLHVECLKTTINRCWLASATLIPLRIFSSRLRPSNSTKRSASSSFLSRCMMSSSVSKGSEISCSDTIISSEIQQLLSSSASTVSVYFDVFANSMYCSVTTYNSSGYHHVPFSELNVPWYNWCKVSTNCHTSYSSMSHMWQFNATCDTELLHMWHLSVQCHSCDIELSHMWHWTVQCHMCDSSMPHM